MEVITNTALQFISTNAMWKRHSGIQKDQRHKTTTEGCRSTILQVSFSKIAEPACHLLSSDSELVTMECLQELALRYMDSIITEAVNPWMTQYISYTHTHTHFFPGLQL